MPQSHFEVRVPFFRPMWRRILVAGATTLWTGVELMSGSIGWAVAFGAIAIYLIWAFFLAWRDPDELTPPKDHAPR